MTCMMHGIRFWMNYPAYFPIETSYEESGGRALAIAEGSVTVSLKIERRNDKLNLLKEINAATLETNPILSLHD